MNASALLGRNANGALALLLGVLLASAWTAHSLSAEDERARADRFDNLVESLNAASSARSRTVDQIYNELRGPNSRQMHQVLREALGRTNRLILQGVVEVLAMLGDPGDLASFEVFLATTSSLEVKTLGLRLLPAFCLGGNERARFNFIRYAAGYERIADPSVLLPLRRPPLTRRGRLDPNQERLQSRVARILAGQFDPVAAALRHVDDILYRDSARAAVAHYIGASLGNDPGRWPRLWEDQGGEENYLVPDEIEEIRLAALLSLSDMGAEGLPEVLDAIGRLLEVDSDILRQAAFETLAVMCRVGHAGFGPLSEMSFSAREETEADGWRRRRFATEGRLAVFAAGCATKNIRALGDPGVFSSAADCLGAALSYPPGFPDPDSALAGARAGGLAVLERLLMMPDLSLSKRVSVLAALGEVGASRSVTAIQSILESPYASPEAGSDGMRMADAAVDALRVVATGGQDGRDSARRLLLELLRDPREFPSPRPGVPPTRLGHIALWRLQRLAKSDGAALDPEPWRERLGW